MGIRENFEKKYSKKMTHRLFRIIANDLIELFCLCDDRFTTILGGTPGVQFTGSMIYMMVRFLKPTGILLTELMENGTTILPWKPIPSLMILKLTLKKTC